MRGFWFQRRFMLSILAPVAVILSGAASVDVAGKASPVMPPNSHAHGRSLAEWSAQYWPCVG